MRPASVLAIAIGVVLAGCVPYPVYVSPAPVPLFADREHLAECARIDREIARQQSIALTSGVMATPLVEVSARLNAANVISGLESRAVFAGCRG